MLNLEYASPSELRWWKAIVAPESGWSIKGSKLSPWATMVRNIEISVECIPDGNRRPPTARRAACYLSRLCEAYDLGSQCSAALAAAMTMPFHASLNYFNPVEIKLPKPSFTTYYGLAGSPRHLPTDFDMIGHYMTLSICTWALGPSLWSVFWTLHVPCNRAGAWLLPIADVLKPVIQNDDMELLARVMSFSPISPLWLGLTLCGRGTIITRIIPSLTKLHAYFPPRTDAAAWTGTAQSCMDTDVSGPSPDGMVLRADVWRMRHDFSFLYSNDSFSHTSVYSWPPFGSMRPEDIELEIRGHLACSHQ